MISMEDLKEEIKLVKLEETDFEKLKNKTPGYLRDTSRPPTFSKMAFRKIKAFFSKIICSFKIFLHFKLQFFPIFAIETSKIRWKDIFKKMPFETQSRKSLTQFRKFQELSRKKLSIQPKKPQL